jgi:putative lipoprotein
MMDPRVKPEDDVEDMESFLNTPPARKKLVVSGDISLTPPPPVHRPFSAVFYHPLKFDQHQHGASIMNNRQPLLSRRSFAGLVALAPLFAAGGAAAAPASLRGSVSYRERIALPPGVTVTVRLIDVSLADAPSQTIAETTIRPRGQVPVPFVLRYDDRDIRARRSYALSAEIRDRDRLLFTTTRRYSVLTGGRDDTDLVLERVGAGPGRPEPEAGIDGRWLVQDIRGERVRGRREATLEISREGRVSGNAGCNGIGGEVKISRNRVNFGRMISTQMACAPDIMRQERQFIEALEGARSFRLEPRRGTLELVDGRGRAVMRLRRA